MFLILKPKPPEGMKLVSGRLTKIQKTTRPDHIWTEIWTMMGRKDREKEIKWWNEECKRRAQARTEKSTWTEIPDAELDEYNKIRAKARKKHSLPPAPAMPVIPYACYAKNGKPVADVREHEEHIEPRGFASHQWFALIHLSFPIQQALKIPAAAKSLDLQSLGPPSFWDLDSVCERKTTMKRKEKNPKLKPFFGSLMETDDGVVS